MVDSVEKIAAVLEGWVAEGMPVTTATAKSLAARLRSIAPEASGADYRQIAHLIGSIFFAGDFKAETANERELEALLIKTGHRYQSWDEITALNPAPPTRDSRGYAND